MIAEGEYVLMMEDSNADEVRVSETIECDARARSAITNSEIRIEFRIIEAQMRDTHRDNR
jgi:hypothetical protein